MSLRHWARAWGRYFGLVWEGWKIALAQRLLANIERNRQERTIRQVRERWKRAEDQRVYDRWKRGANDRRDERRAVR